MVIYFSGTGNSRYIANRLSDALHEKTVDLNSKIKSNDVSAIETYDNITLVTPTYAWRIPRIVSDWLLKMELKGAKRIWFVMTCGSEIGNASKYNRSFAEQKGLRYMGTAQIVMPENYIAMFNAPRKEEAQRIVSNAQPSISQVIEHIKKEQEFSLPRNNLYDRFMSGPINPIFYKFFVKAKEFHATEACIDCGKCAKDCPMNNIELKNNLPVWTDRCTHCMACICYCPTKAIEYGKKSVGKPRYRFEELQYGGNKHESTDD